MDQAGKICYIMARRRLRVQNRVDMTSSSLGYCLCVIIPMCFTAVSGFDSWDKVTLCLWSRYVVKLCVDTCCLTAILVPVC